MVVLILNPQHFFHFFQNYLYNKKIMDFIESRNLKRDHNSLDEHEQQICLATYNMSFASDKGMYIDDVNTGSNYPSEMSFLAQIPNEEEDKRKFWKNAVRLLFEFIDEHKESYSLVIGLQEMNFTNHNNSGTSFIITQLGDKFNSAVAELVVAEDMKPSLMTIWSKELFGEVIINKIYEIANDYSEMTDDNNNIYKNKFALSKPLTDINQTGRPIMFTYTNKGYLFINVHSTNSAADSANKYEKQCLLIKNKYNLFIEDCKSSNHINDVNDIDKTKIFMVGDFNDRYNGLAGQINLSDDIILKFDGDPPLSCCHNIDSSCKSDKYSQNNFTFNEKAKDCAYDNNKYKPAGPRTRDQIKLLGEDGYIENYRYYGDYCFSLYGGPLVIYRYDERKKSSSNESDHELVFMISNAPNNKRTKVGGGMKKKRKNRIRKTRMRKTRMRKRKTRMRTRIIK